MKQRILIKGPFLSLSGYGHQARFALNALRSREDLFDIYVVNTGWGNTSWISNNEEFRRWVEERLMKTINYVQAGGQFDINLQVTIPNEIEKAAPVNILYTAGIETTKVAPQWLEAVNTIDKVIVVSSHSKQIFDITKYGVQNQAGQRVGNLGCTTPIDVVNYPVNKVKAEKLPLELDCDFNFLTMAQWGPRKDVENVITSFLKEFWEEEVGLVVKTFVQNNSLIDRETTEERLNKLIERVEKTKPNSGRKCKLYLLHGALTEGEIHGLYKRKDISAFVTATHGEGFGLSLFESAYSALPVVAPGWSGHMDFLVKDGEKMFVDLTYNLQPVSESAVWEGVIQKDSLWAFVAEKELKEKMRYVYENLAKVEKSAKKLKKYLVKEFTEEKKYAEFVESVMSVVPDANLSADEIDDWLNDMDINLIEAD